LSIIYLEILGFALTNAKNFGGFLGARAGAGKGVARPGGLQKPPKSPLGLSAIATP
jgi:hypothetical protein